MRKFILLAAITALVLATLACGVTFDLPITTDIKLKQGLLYTD